MPTYLWKCQKCEMMAEVFRSLSDYEKPPENLDEETPSCPHEWTRTVQSPMPLRASYLDGQRSRTDGNWAKLKEANKLEQQMMNQPFQERKEFKKEIRKLKEVGK